MARVCEKTLYSDQKLTVTVLQSLEFQADGSAHWGFLLGSLEPIAIIVREPDRTYALDPAGQPVDIDRIELPADFNLK